MNDHLYGFDGDEYLEDSPEAVYERWADDYDYQPDGMLFPGAGRPERLEIIRWTVQPSGDILPPSWRVLEWLEEMVCDDIGYEEAADALHRAVAHPDVVAAMDRVRDEIAARFTGWKFANGRDGVHIVTWDDDHEPLLDGEPMYVKRTEQHSE